MAFDPLVVERFTNHLINKIESGHYNAFDLMVMYKESISEDDYEKAQAINLVLSHTPYKVSDTHAHIPNINQNFWSHIRKLRYMGFNGAYYQAPGINQFKFSKDQVQILFISNYK